MPFYIHVITNGLINTDCAVGTVQLWEQSGCFVSGVAQFITVGAHVQEGYSTLFVCVSVTMLSATSGSK